MKYTKEQLLEIFEADELLHPSYDASPDDLMNLHLDLAELILKGYAELYFEDGRPMVKATKKSQDFVFNQTSKKTIPMKVHLTFTPEMLN